MADFNSKVKEKPEFKTGSFGWMYYHLSKRKRGILITLLCVLFVVVLFIERIVIFVDAGEAGVLFKRFGGGTELDRIYSEGIHYIYPWDEMTVYNVRIQHEPRQFEVLSANGLKVQVEASIRYRPFQETLPDLHQQVGVNYAERIVIPEVEAVIRQIFGQYLPEEIYSSQDFIVQNTVQNAIFEVSERFVDLDELLITHITLPDYIVQAIEEKLEKEQVALGYQYRLDSERLEAERKRIEAEGIRDFQSIISEGITENYLRFRGIEATLSLASSNNSKIVVIGGGRDGLPIILDGTGSDVSSELSAGNNNQSGSGQSIIPNYGSASGNTAGSSDTAATGQSGSGSGVPSGTDGDSATESAGSDDNSGSDSGRTGLGVLLP